MKRVTAGPAARAAQRDPYVELDVSGRRLTDEGFAEIATALATTVSHEGEHGKVVRLEELCLAGNALTAGSLLALAKVVQDAAAELRDLDLSGNNISVTNVEDVLAWEEFLKSFRECFVLRRLDLGGNALGPWAFEILARVYGDEAPLDLLALDEETEFSPDGFAQAEPRRSYEGVGGWSMRVGNLKVESETRDDTERSLANVKEGSKRKNSRKGQLSQALFKSPTHLAVATDSSPSKTATHAAEAQSMFATTRGLRSISYIIFSNTSMTDTCALHLSHVVENHNLPKQLMPYVPSKAGSSAHELEAYETTTGCHGIVYLPDDEIGTAGLKVLEVAERVRKGENEGLQGNSSPSKSSYSDATYSRRVSEATSNSSPTQPRRRRRSTMSSGVGTRFAHTGGTRSVPSELDQARSRIQGGLLKDPGPQAVELWSASVKMLSIARGILLEPGEEKVVDTRSPPGKTASIEAASQLIYGQAPGPWGLSEALWRPIIALASGAVGVLSSKQQESIVQWARDRGTLGREREAVGKSQSEQIWRVLEAMGCLAYDVKT